ncbi:MAG: esterase family protein [Candidatus Promineifilaceae bacterium]
MQRRLERIYSPALERDVDLLAYGHYGAPVIAFPSGGGRYIDFEGNEMISALAPLIEGGKIKVYCTDGIDNESWLNSAIAPHLRAVRHNAYQDFIISNLVPSIRADCHDSSMRVGLVGCSLGGLHAANFALKFPELFHYSLCMSGRYDLTKICGESASADVYFNNPLAYTHNLHGQTLDDIRHNTHIALVCGQGAWEEKCLAETHRLADVLADKGISHERDIWGQDVEHHWYWWRKQIVHHLGKTFT